MGKKKRSVKSIKNGVDVGDKWKQQGNDKWGYTWSIPKDYNDLIIANVSNRKEDPLSKWTPPETEDCPICLTPLPLEPGRSWYWGCCGKSVCWGCRLDSLNHSIEEGGVVDFTCHFCREDYESYTLKRTEKERTRMEFDRYEKGSGDAAYCIAKYYWFGVEGLKKNVPQAIKWFRKASDAGNGEACLRLGRVLQYGMKGMMEMNREESIKYYERAAELGCLRAYKNLAEVQMEHGLIEESVLSARKAMMCGVTSDIVTENVLTWFKMKYMTKEEYAFTLRTHQSAVESFNSPSRKEAIARYHLGKNTWDDFA